ncbi:heterochromatin protein 1-like [Prionailurus iriomotensis]
MHTLFAKVLSKLPQMPATPHHETEAAFAVECCSLDAGNKSCNNLEKYCSTSPPTGLYTGECEFQVSLDVLRLLCRDGLLSEAGKPDYSASLDIFFSPYKS